MDDKLKAIYERVTPLKAQEWLNRNKNNRNLRPGVAEKYTADMKAGRWTKCPAPIVFYENGGDLADGQHRLWAVVQSDKSQEFLVVRDFPRDAAINIDTGASRSLIDNARIAGERTDLSHRLLAVCRAIENPKVKKTRALSYAERLALVDKHADAAKWAITNGPSVRGIALSVVHAAMARAYYAGEDRDRLEYFGRVMQRGFSQGEEDTAGVSIRNYIQGLASPSQMNFDEIFCKVQNALWYFMRRKPLHQIKKYEEERYPLKRK